MPPYVQSPVFTAPWYYPQQAQQTVWVQWNQPTLTTGSTLMVDPWNGWVTNVTTNGGYYPPTTAQITPQAYVWNHWNATPQFYGAPCTNPVVAEPTPADERRALIARNRSHALVLRRKFANRRAEALLLEHLTDRQREQWEHDKSFTVITADGAREYRIARGMAGNVRLIKMEGEAPRSKHGNPLRVGSRFCMHVYHPDGSVPDDDNVLAQALLLQSEGGEDHFLSLANVS